MRLKYYMRGLGIGILVTVFLMSAALKGKGQEPMTDEQIRERAAALGMVEQGGTLLDTMPDKDAEAAKTDGDSALGDENPVKDKEETSNGKTQKNKTASGETQDKTVTGQSGDGVQASAQGDAGEAGTPREQDENVAIRAGEARDRTETASQKSGAAQESSGGQRQPAAAQESSGSQGQPAAAQESSGGQRQPAAAQGSSGGQEQPAAQSGGGAESPGTEKTGMPDQGKTPFVIASGMSSYGTSKALAELGLVDSASGFDGYLCQNGFDSKICAGSFEIPKGATYAQIAEIITKKN